MLTLTWIGIAVVVLMWTAIFLSFSRRRAWYTVGATIAAIVGAAWAVALCVFVVWAIR